MGYLSEAMQSLTVVDGTSPGRCLLLELPAEIRELIWIHAVTEWAPARSEREDQVGTLQKQPIRIDRFTLSMTPAITRTCRQIRAETIALYYEQNDFEIWQPKYWLPDFSRSLFFAWLTPLVGNKRNG